MYVYDKTRCRGTHRILTIAATKLNDNSKENKTNNNNYYEQQSLECSERRAPLTVILSHLDNMALSQLSGAYIKLYNK